MAHQILVRIDVDEEYKDVDPQIAADDYMEGSKAYGWEVITERVYTHSEVEAIVDYLKAEAIFAVNATSSWHEGQRVMPPAPVAYLMDEALKKHGITLDPTEQE